MTPTTEELREALAESIVKSSIETTAKVWPDSTGPWVHAAHFALVLAEEEPELVKLMRQGYEVALAEAMPEHPPEFFEAQAKAHIRNVMEDARRQLREAFDIELP